MAILYIDLTFNSNVSTQVDDKGWITATAKMEYNVFVDDVADTELILRQSQLLPKEKSGHPNYLFLFCDSIDIQRQGPRHFIYSVSYKSPPYKSADKTDTPLSEPTQISYFTITNEGPAEEDITGKSITTKCGEPLYGVTRAYSDLGIRLTKNFATFTPASFYQFINTTNSELFLGFPSGTLWISSISSEEQFFETVPYWKVTVEINARKPYRQQTSRAWWARVRHQGFRAFKQVGNRYEVQKILKNGEPISSPALLNSQGFEIVLNTPGVDPIAHWLEFQIYPSSRFQDMGFGI
jgi:hypothetical protein